MRVASPPAKPLLIYDGECNFCRRWIARWEESTGDRVDYRQYQDAEITQQFPEIPVEDFAKSIQFIEPDGTVYSGAEAALRALERQWMYDRIPGFAPVSEWAYRLVARHRGIFSFLTRWLLGQKVTRPSYILTREIFIRGLGVVYLFAFVSLWLQIDGLMGSHGIAPVADLIQRNQGSIDHNGPSAYLMLPTVFWFANSDAILHAVCGIGAVLSLCVIAGFGVGPALALLWFFYLSLMQVGDVFMGYQWDALLLEVGFLAFWFAPWGWTPRSFRQSRPPQLVLLMLRWLVFRLLFCSGVVKLSSGDISWHSWTALMIHYQTQPLPTWTAWYAHQLPEWFQKFCCGTMFAIEILLPFLIMGTRRMRFVTAWGVFILMAAISLTGNYCFFNLLTILLGIILLDDAAIEWGVQKLRLSRWIRRPRTYDKAWSMARWRNYIFVPVAVTILIITIPTIPASTGKRPRWPRWYVQINYLANFWYSPLHSANSYGLFAVMTTVRPEIVVEGSRDGKEWLPYEFKYKPGDVRRRPPFVWPHQPRIDWQMWFEALRVLQPRPGPSAWYYNFCGKLLEGEPAVLRLMANNPFPKEPPLYIRSQVYVYKFTDPATRKKTGEWWMREPQGPYGPILALKNRADSDNGK